MLLDQTYLAAISAILSIIAFLPYIWAILRGIVRPQRSSWLIWTVLSTTAFFAVLSSGATNGLWFTGAQAAGTATIFLLSLWRGAGSLWSRMEGVILALTAVGLGLWWTTDTAAYALAISIALGALGGSLTVIKAYRAPVTEALDSWMLQTTAAGFGVASVVGTSWMEMAYPVYLLILYATILSAVLLGGSLARRALT